MSNSQVDPAPTVLIVDDNRELRAGMSRYMALVGYDVTEAADGRSAIVALSGQTRFRFILVDLSLPDMDGREVAREARRLAPETWIVLVTGWDVEIDEVRDSGVDRVFHKPVNLPDLCQSLAEAPSHAPPH